MVWKLEVYDGLGVHTQPYKITYIRTLGEDIAPRTYKNMEVTLSPQYMFGPSNLP